MLYGGLHKIQVQHVIDVPWHSRHSLGRGKRLINTRDTDKFTVSLTLSRDHSGRSCWMISSAPVLTSLGSTVTLTEGISVPAGDMTNSVVRELKVSSR